MSGELGATVQQRSCHAWLQCIRWRRRVVQLNCFPNRHYFQLIQTLTIMSTCNSTHYKYVSSIINKITTSLFVMFVNKHKIFIKSSTFSSTNSVHRCFGQRFNFCKKKLYNKTQSLNTYCQVVMFACGKNIWKG